MKFAPASLALIALSACGPVQSTAYLMDAEVQIEAARTAQAERYAPYEWTSANLYYRKSKEEVGYSDFEQAVDFAQKAQKFAVQARENAMKATRKEEQPSPAKVP
ncbi:MAG: DUF4398 domain-containing protein [Myxococcaceae bacterium]|nr:DUF4398 domain-containing protein [Myxococcaceae bacterium]